MSSPDEIITFACNKDANAMAFCKSWVDFCHAVDDLWDRDKPMTLGDIMGKVTCFIVNVSSNPFYRQHAARFESLIEQSIAAWVASEDYRNTNGAIADVLKGFYHEVIYHAARICGGWKHGLDTAAKFREYDFEKGN